MLELTDIDPTLSISLELKSDNINWTGNPEYDYVFVQMIMQHMVDRYHALGYLFVNDVAVRLGIHPTPEGQLVGWLAKDGDYILWEIDKDAPDDMIVVNLQPAGFIWNKL